MAFIGIMTRRVWSAIASAAAAVAIYGAARGADYFVVHVVHPRRGEVLAVSDMMLATAFGVAFYLWLNLRATRTRLTGLERAQIVMDTQLSLAAQIQRRLLPPIPVGRLVLDRMPDNFFAETEQVAFMTQNVPPGIDFSNDPLLQGRNFSYLDTQLKRLGSANFTHIPINAPKCPFHHFQQDGHMAMRNPVGHVNYQPNSFGEGPRESPERGFHVVR